MFVKQIGCWVFNASENKKRWREIFLKKKLENKKIKYIGGH